MTNIENLLKPFPIVPVVVCDNINDGLQLAKILEEENLPIMEITLRTPIALDIIKEISTQFKNITLGAGTIKTPKQFEAALTAGAKFCVSPGMTQTLASEAQRMKMPYLPGVATVSEVIFGQENGLDFFKLFPASALNSLEFLKTMASPFPDTLFCPTGGINPQNYLSFLSLENVPCIGGSWICSTELIKTGQWQKIRTLIQTAIANQP